MMEVGTKATGTTMSGQAMESKPGVNQRSKSTDILDSSKTTSAMAMECIPGQVDPYMLVNGVTET